MEMHNVYTDTVLVAGTVPATSAETVAIILPGNVSVPVGTLIVLEAVATWTAGSSTTAIVARIRRGTTTAGTLVGQAFTNPATASAANTIAAQCADTPGEVAGQQYCLTLQQTSGAANGSALFASLQASWIA